MSNPSFQVRHDERTILPQDALGIYLQALNSELNYAEEGN